MPEKNNSYIGNHAGSAGYDSAEAGHDTGDDIIVVSVNDDSKKIRQILSNETSMKIVSCLKEERLSASAISKKLDVPLPTVKYNLDALVESGLVRISSVRYSEKGRQVKIYEAPEKIIVFAPEKSGPSIAAMLKKYAAALCLAVGGGIIFSESGRFFLSRYGISTDMVYDGNDAGIHMSAAGPDAEESAVLFNYATDNKAADIPGEIPAPEPSSFTASSGPDGASGIVSPSLPGNGSGSASVSDAGSAAEPAATSAATSAAEPAAQSAATFAAEPAAEPAAELAAESASESVTTSVSDSVSRMMTDSAVTASDISSPQSGVTEFLLQIYGSPLFWFVLGAVTVIVILLIIDFIRRKKKTTPASSGNDACDPDVSRENDPADPADSVDPADPAGSSGSDLSDPDDTLHRKNGTDQTVGEDSLKRPSETTASPEIRRRATISV